MRYKLIALSFLTTTLILSGCQSGVTNIPVSGDSETGHAINKFSDVEGQYQKNVAAYRKAMMDYEQAHRGKCGTIFFSSLSTPIQIVGPRVQIYKLQGSSNECGYEDYKVEITYEDGACRIVKQVEVLEKITQ